MSPSGLIGPSSPSNVKASEAPTTLQAGIVRDFKAAWEAMDIAGLIGILDPDAIAITDGGGSVRAALHPIHGGEQVARAYVEIAARAPNITVLERTVNGQPGLVVQQEGLTVTDLR